jgi:hypothetical protein
MTPAEVGALRRAYASAARILEFGAGGSTFVAAAQLPRTLERLISVESDPQWAARANLTARLAAPALFPRFRGHEMRLVDVGAAPDAWGYPSAQATADEKARYPFQLLNGADADVGAVDVVLVDGRFRVACALAFALREPPLAPAARLVVHDYVDRPYYSDVIAPFFDEEERADTLVVLRRRALAAPERARARELYEEYKTQPR